MRIIYWSSDWCSSDLLSVLIITLTNAVDGDAEQLEVSLEAAGALGIAVSGNGTTSLTLSGAARPADYQELLYTLTYDNSVAEPTAGIRTIEIQAADGGASNNLSLVAIASNSVTAAAQTGRASGRESVCQSV